MVGTGHSPSTAAQKCTESAEGEGVDELFEGIARLITLADSLGFPWVAIDLSSARDKLEDELGRDAGHANS